MTYGGWVAGYWDDFMGRVMGEQMAKPFDLVLGRRTYEIFAAHWPYIKDDPLADKLNAARKYVVSTTMEKPGWNNSALIASNVVQQIKRLKEQDGPELQVHGSGNLIQTLLRILSRLFCKFDKRLYSQGFARLSVMPPAAPFPLLAC